MKKQRHEIGTIIAWANDGEESYFDTIAEAAEQADCTVEELENALGTDTEIGGATYFRYGVDTEATKGYDDAWNEVE